MQKLGINREDLKRKNRGLALKLVATGQCGSRIELSKKTGLTKTAISQIVNELIENGLLTETHKKSINDVGRKPMGLTVAPDAPKCIGVLLQRGYGEAVLCDMQMNILNYRKIEKEWYTGDELMESVYELVDAVMPEDGNVFGIGAASVGPVNVNEGKIVNPAFFNHVANVEVERLLRERYGLPVSLDHDNQSAALAEKLFGNGRSCKDILLVGIGDGVGCGIIVQDERYQSYSGYAPEIGHVSIDYHGKACFCGNKGCLENYIRSAVVKKRMREATGWDMSYKEFCSRCDCPAIDEIIRDVIEKLGIAITSVLNMLNSDMIILGLDGVYWPDTYIDLLEENINRGKYGNKEVRTRVKKAYFMEKAHVLGAACNILDKVFQGNY
ncbi:MAG: ROK family transcriptional regulator [Eubacteriales bacterium]|nr:ROK family transcriptional regulator [Eubacteriales bacterium]